MFLTCTLRLDMVGLTSYQCNALIVAFMKLDPFPWRLTHDCLKSLLKQSFDMKDFHHCMHIHGGTLFNYWRQYLYENAPLKYKAVIKKYLFDNHRERFRAVWMLREDNTWRKLRSVGDWCDNRQKCLMGAYNATPPYIPQGFDYPEKVPLKPKDTEIMLTVESECVDCAGNCTCQLPVRCPVKHIYDVPYGFVGNVKTLTTARGLTYAYTHHTLENCDIEHYVINGVHVLRETPSYDDDAGLDGTCSYYIATYDEWIVSQEQCPILAFEEFMKFEKCQCWNATCPCNE